MNLLLSFLVSIGLGLAAVGARPEAFLFFFWISCGAFGWTLGGTIGPEIDRRRRKASR